MSISQRARRFILPGIDVAVVVAATYLAYFLRFDGMIPLGYSREIPAIMALSLAVYIPWFTLFRLYRRAWRYASVMDLAAIAFAVFLGMVTLFVAREFFPTFVIPRGVVAIEGLLVGAFAGGARFARRATQSFLTSFSNSGQTGSDASRILIVGAGSAGVMSLREIRDATRWQVVGFVDDDPAKAGERVLGVPVLGSRRSIPEVARRERVDQILIAMPSVSRQEIAEIVQLAQKTGCQVRIVPALHELMDGRVSINQIREVQIEDLLGRTPVRTDLKDIRSYVAGRAVLVTGAGGSIGSELCRQLSHYGPARLVLMGHGENSIFDIQNELQGRNQHPEIVPCIADTRDSDKMDALFATWKPNVVFHAAAHKHVPLMEANPDEAVSNNVFGTLNLVRAADRHGVERFVMISTDKAVNPVNCMGASKRVAEMIVQGMNGESDTRFVAVRFGNVLGSRGSVIPTFKRQIAAGGPVTVTHPEMRRYFMTIPEAVQLVLQAGSLAEGGEIYLLNMGEPVKIVDLARDMIHLSGFEPGVDIPIAFTGPRPGEKLFEELNTDGEDVERTGHTDIVKVMGQEVDAEWLQRGLHVLRGQLEAMDLDALRGTLLAVGQERHTTALEAGATTRTGALREVAAAKNLAEDGVSTYDERTRHGDLLINSP